MELGYIYIGSYVFGFQSKHIVMNVYRLYYYGHVTIMNAYCIELSDLDRKRISQIDMIDR